MSRINTQSFLNTPSIQPNVSPIPLQPQYNQSQFVGGGMQIGQPAQTVGPSSEVAMYQSLAEIAGGVQKSLDIFGDIGSRIDKEVANQAEIEYEKINLSEDTPEVKFERLEEVLRNAETPLIGSSWKERMALQGQRSWMTDEARDQFEQQRYNKEFTKFLNKPENKNKAASPELMQRFNLEYRDRYPTSEFNNWYRVKAFETDSAVIQKQVEDALNSFGPSIDLAFAVPNQEQQSAIINGNQETMQMFQPFIGLADKARVAESRESFRKMLQEEIKKNVIDTLDPRSTPPEVYEELARRLPAIAKTKANEIWDVAWNFREAKVQEQAATSLKTAEQTFKTSNQKSMALGYYLTTVSNNIPSLNAPVREKRNAMEQIIPTIVDVFDNAITTGSDAELSSKYPAWGEMSATERIDIAEKEFGEWIKNNPENAKRMVESLAFTPEELKGIGAQSPEQAAEILLVKNARLAALNSKPIADRIKLDDKELETRIQTTTQSLGSMVSEQAILDHAKYSFESIAEDLGIGVDKIETMYTVENGVRALPKSFDAWLGTLSPEERDNLQKRGYTLGVAGYNRLMFAASLALNTQNAAEQRINYLKTQADKVNQNTMLDVDQLTDQFAKINPTSNSAIPSDKGTFESLLLSGKFSTDAGLKKSSSVFAMYMQSRAIQDKAIAAGRTPETYTAEERNAVNYILQVQSELPIIRNFEESYNRTYLDLASKLPSFNRQVPRATSAPISEEKSVKESIEEFNSYWQDVTTGKLSWKPETFPQTIIDPDGSWSAEARGNFMVAQLTATRALAPGSNESMQRDLAQHLDTLMSRIGTYDSPEALSSDQAKYDLTMLALISREYKKASETPGQGLPAIHGVNAFRVRATIAGNWAEEVDIPTMLETLNSPETRNTTNHIMSVVSSLGARNNRERSIVATERGVTGQLYLYRNNKALQVASALGAQPEVATIAESGRQFISNTISPNDPRWNAGRLITALNEAGITVDATTLAQAFRQKFLSSMPSATLDQMTDADIIRTGVIALESSARGNNALFMDALDLAFGDRGINDPRMNNQGKADKLNLFLDFMDVSMDIDSGIHQGGNRIGVTTLDKSIVFAGTTAEGETIIPQFSPVTIVQGRSLNQSWTNSVVGQLNFDAVNTGKNSVLMERLNTAYPPADITGRNINQKGKANGSNWFTGTVVLDAPPVDDQRARFSLIQAWAAAHGIKSVEEVYASGSSLNLTVDRSYQSLQRESARTAIQEALNDRDSTSTLDWLSKLDAKYVASGGANGLINREELRRKREGFSTLVQNPPSSVSSTALPTYLFSRTGVNGIPYITVTDAYFYNEENKIRPSFASYMQEKIKPTPEEEARIKRVEQELQNIPFAL